MKVKFILPALTEAKSPYYRPIKYSLFPPLGLATLAAYLSPDDEAVIIDEHVEELSLDDNPDLVAIEVYITNAYRTYAIADSYRKRGIVVVLGGLHVTSLPEEAEKHADAIFLGPAEQSFPQFLKDLREKKIKKRYFSTDRSLENEPPIRRDLIKRHLYLVPNSLVVSRGCPHHCDFCYKEAFFKGGKSFYTQKVQAVLCEIERLPGKHLYFLDDHLFASPVFAANLFDTMKGMGRVFQGAATVNSILKGNLLQKAVDAGLRSLFVGFETLSISNLRTANKKQNLIKDYHEAIQKLHDHGVMINGSFVFGFDDDDPEVFDRTVDWAVSEGITTATFHILTPYPGTKLFNDYLKSGRIEHFHWDLYDTRHVVYKPNKISSYDLKIGYERSYEKFYSWSNIWKASLQHDALKHIVKHLAYAGGWKKFEPLWNVIIKYGALNQMLPVLEALLSKVGKENMDRKEKSDNIEKLSKNRIIIPTIT
jgi:radical SAM superfamily enzyme YgiQ (UPF0313 family)